MTTKPKVRTCLWFDGNGAEAAEFYVSLLPGSKVESSFSAETGATPLVIDFTLAGTPYQILNAGPQHPQTEAASISVLTKDQEETDRLWAALLADGGGERVCAWLRDRYGVFWQIVPEALPRLLSDPDRAASGRAFQAMMQMVKIDIAALEAAFHGK